MNCIRYKEEIFHDEGVGALEQAARRSCGWLIPWSGEGQGGWHFEKPGLVESVSTLSMQKMYQKFVCYEGSGRAERTLLGDTKMSQPNEEN